MQLIIVESPTKARTLARFLGSQFQIEASMGHLRDLPSKKLGVDIEHGFEPEYVIDKKKQATVTKLKQAAKSAESVILATDPDREGEAIAWHLQYILKNPKSEARNPKFSRIVFHEITQSAIEAALKNPGQVDLKLVDSQQARRILDRLVGYKLSPLLWRKVRRGLSAGRVQSVAVRLIVEREQAIKTFAPREYWEIKVELQKDGSNFLVQLSKNPANKAESQTIVNDLEAANYQVLKLDQKNLTRHAYPPLITSTLQRLAGNRLGWSAKKTMTMAQHLYENGLITYHRTDSVNLAKEAMEMARQYINSTYGKNYLPDQPNYYKSRSKNVQGAHEAIRPTKLNNDVNELGKSEQKLYNLIWQRFVASQMKAAVFTKTVVVVQAKAVKEYELKAEAEKLEFDGWMKETDGFRQTEVNLPKLAVGDKLQLVKVLSEQKFTQPPNRYTEASLIKELEKKGIGRPSTYAPIISTIQDRYYVEKEEQKLKPTAIGETVTGFLMRHFETIMDYDFTAKMEDDLDQIALGKLRSPELLKNFYFPFDKKLIEVTEKAERAKIATEATGQNCPDCHEGKIVIRLGRFGKFLSCSRFPECKYTANYKDVVPGITCPQCGNEVVVKKTRRGKSFYGCGNYPNCKWASWNKPKGLQGDSS